MSPEDGRRGEDPRFTESLYARIARIEENGRAREETLRELRRAHEKLAEDVASRFDRIDGSMEDLADKLGSAIVKAFDRASETFASRETVSWWTGLLTKALVGLVVLGITALLAGHLRFPL